MDTVDLRFDKTVARGDVTNLSALCADGEHLWLAGDEAAAIELLTRQDDGGYASHRTFRLADLVRLPDGADEEVDIEGLARDDHHLWAVGSHALVRKKKGAKPKPNRRILVRLPVTTDADGAPALGRGAILGRKPPTLADLVADDPQLGPSTAVPSKENGFEIEGLAAYGDAILAGLRGPVLDGQAVVLELRPYTKPGKARLRVDGYRVHRLDLGGLGIRDLCPDEATGGLLVLAGPTMAHAGPVRVYRWRPGDRPAPACDLPSGAEEDHPEGIAVVDGGDTLVVVYDHPSPVLRNKAVKVSLRTQAPAVVRS
jgi:hypothetical protein